MTSVNTSNNTSSSSSSSSSTSSSSSSTNGTLDYNSFLKLLVAELKNQDPTQPTDPMQYTTQMATFSQVEQSVNMNNKLASLLTSSSMSQAENAIGHTVTSADGKTSGVISAVTINSDGSLTATLKSGSTLNLANGVKIS